MDELEPGQRVMFVGTEAWSIELYGATGTVFDGPGAWGTYGVLMDPEHDPDQMLASFDRDELEAIEDGVAVYVDPGVRIGVGLAGSPTTFVNTERGWAPEVYVSANGYVMQWEPGGSRPTCLGHVTDGEDAA